MTALVMNSRRAKQEALHRLLERERQAAAAATRAEIVGLLNELKEELTGKEEWSVKKATWTMAILAAEGKFDKKRKRPIQGAPPLEGEALEEVLEADFGSVRNAADSLGL